ncbi:hypothetical protein C5D16_09030 [Rathayibacter toxicus]|nr:hypothetical protein C5D15_09065 [Rathayibacter toxicus]PPG45739.1 hypothetical protein C5D16_09030 [Rathayibacter toxicus]PPH71712.1 hypothetical protein C5D24_08990 [Rathayibacter toxicus]PPI22299.1 hypothetical protein C5D55_09080 [Rathayibacter toxicus]PPI44153.1 hypothetical protein C5D43_09020 [Rathayibacter toxicus]
MASLTRTHAVPSAAVSTALAPTIFFSSRPVIVCVFVLARAVLAVPTRLIGRVLSEGPEPPVGIEPTTFSLRERFDGSAIVR